MVNRQKICSFFALLSVLVLSSCGTFESKPQYSDLKIINWNILYSFNHKQSTDSGIQWLKQKQAGVVGLQELNGNTELSLNEMARQWGHMYSVILKEKGFPVGLTSKEPIEVIERKIEGFHHGFLHCRTYGIDFFIVHFWPGKNHEVEYILEKIERLHENGRRVILMGDFNAHSRKDSEFLATKQRVDARFEVVDRVESKGFVDVVHKHDAQAKISCASPITIPRWSKTIKELESKQCRIDFVFADKALADHSVSATIIRSDELDKISDHYPVVAQFRLPVE